VDSDDARLVDNAIFGNATTNVSDGGGIAIGTYSAATLERNTITGNTADRNGGGLSVGDGTAVTLTNNVIARNTCCDASGWVGGAGVWLGSGDHALIHNTFADNAGGDGAGIRLYGDAVLTNTIIANQTAGVVAASAGAAATLEGTLWYGNDRDADGPGTVVTGTVDHHGDPTFVHPGADDYHLAEGSPAIDAGVDSGVGDDLDGDTRPRGLTYDVGADETLDPIVPPAGVSINGPATGLIETMVRFSATVDPATATLPSYAWAPEPQSGQGTAQAAYRWSTGGVKPLTVTVSNRAGTARAGTTVRIQGGTVTVFLPLVLRHP
jgi:parallel beta-helix repeat protein